jgi:hypothetical protein
VDKWVVERMVLQMERRKKKANAGSNILQQKVVGEPVVRKIHARM